MSSETNESVIKLGELIEGIDFCMLTTIDEGNLRSRPMSTQDFEFDGNLWFFSSDQTHKIEELRRDDRVNVSYSKPSDSTFVSVSGRVDVVKDQAKIDELWSPVLKAWFPEGPDDPHLCLLKVKVEQAEYWDTPSGKVVQLFGFLRALATGEEFEPGENKKIDF